MRDLLKRISEDTDLTLDAVLHLGAGTCRELEDYLRLNAGRVMLVEANPKLATQLRAMVRDSARVEVVDAAAAETSGEATLWVLNKSRESSLHRPAQLLKRYPNLSVARNDTVRTITLNELVEQLSPDASNHNLLVLELQGAELSVLSPTPPKVLQKFSWILTRSSTEALYESGARLNEVDAVLRNAGFARVAPVENVAGLPFQEVLYRRDALQIQLADMNGLLQEREQTIQSQHQSLENHIKLVAESQSEIERITKERDEQAHGHQECKKWADDLQRQKQALEQERADLTQRLRRDKQEIERLAKSKDDQTKTISELHTLVEQLKTERIVQTRLAAERQSEMELLTKEHEEQERALLESKKCVEDLQQQRQTLEQQRDDQAMVAGDQQRQIEQLLRELDEKSKRLSGLEQALSGTEQRGKEYEYRQRMLDEEIVRAEAQIALIKDVLLREKAL